MPLQFEFTDKSTLFVRASGNVTYAEVQRAFDDLATNPRHNGDVSVLTDARQVTDVPCTADLRVIAEDLRRLFGRSPGTIAIVTESPFVYGVARMFGVFAERVSVNVRAFRCMEEARTWLLASRTGDSSTALSS
jgi:hypothetical protein